MAVWDIFPLPVLFLSVHTQDTVCTLLSRCQPQSSDSSCLLTSAHPTHVPVFLPPHWFFFLHSFTPLSFWSTFPFHFHPSSSTSSSSSSSPPPSPERLICDWACCVFLSASRSSLGGQRAAEMPQCLYIPACAQMQKKKKRRKKRRKNEKRLTFNHLHWKKAGIQLRMDGGGRGGWRRRRRRKGGLVL